MTSFQDRERAEEAKFAADQELEFKIHARRNKLLGLWAAEQMGLTPVEAEAYGRDIIHADFEMAGDDDVVKKLLGDFTSAGIEIDEPAIRRQIEDKSVLARRQLIEVQE